MQSKELNALLDQLLLLDPIEATQVLSDRLAETAWQDMDESEIAAVVGAALPFLTRMAGRLRASLRQSGLPLSDRGLSQLDALLRIYRNAQMLLNLKLTAMQEPAETTGFEEHLVRAHQERVEWAVRGILDCYMAYVDVPKSLYVDLHQFVDLARIELAQEHATGWQAIYYQYISILTLAMINPYGLTQDEMEESYDCLIRVAPYIEIVHEEPTRTSRFIDVTGKIMPHIALTPRSNMAGAGMFIDVGELYQPSILSTLMPRCRAQVQHLLSRLQFYFVSHMPRTVPSGAGHASTLITLGYLSVHHRLERLASHDSLPNSTLALAGVDWEGLEQPIRGAIQPMLSASDFKMDINSLRADGEVDWNGPEGGLSMGGGHPGHVHEPNIWDVVNFSPSGFRLHWRLAANSRAAVDDLLLAELAAGSSTSTIAIGVVRWVRHMQEGQSSVDMGVQRLSGEAFASYARDFRAADSRWSKTWPVIMLTNEHAVIVRAIVPASLVEETQEILVMRDEKEIRVHLGAVYQTGEGFLIMEASRADV
ncbi:hypothetical protein [Halothiobacillus sp.]|uniref:hypothetical protein n=1 Tax=Halothiobacillus sp. TaxID=1891311 RepID=UPI002AD46FAF|nr:hypothetical protein [Halothiobacillus sp.]